MKTLVLLVALLCSAFAVKYNNKGEKLCNFCKAFIGGIESAMEKGETSLVQAGDKLCDELTAGNVLLDPICRGLVEAELPNIVMWIEKNEDANTICKQIHLC